MPDFEISIKDAKILFDLEGIDKDVLDFAKKIFADIGAIDISQENLSFIHNDIQFHNLIINPTTKRITGLIDWTDVCIAPISREFSAWEWLHDEQLKQVIELYEEKTGTKVDFYQAKLWKYLEELSDYAEHIKTGDKGEAKQSLDHIIQWMAVVG